MARSRRPVFQLAPVRNAVQGVKGITCSATIRGAWLSLAGAMTGSGSGGGVPGGRAVRVSGCHGFARVGWLGAAVAAAAATAATAAAARAR